MRSVPISGVVLTLTGDPGAVAASLASDPRISFGEAQGRHVPAVLETRSLEECERLVEAIAAKLGVTFVDVVTVDFSEIDALEEDDHGSP